MGKIIDKLTADPKKTISTICLIVGTAITGVGGFIDHSRKDDIFREELRKKMDKDLLTEVCGAIKEMNKNKES